MVRWLQLFFAIIAFSTVVDFYTTFGIDITCPPPPNSTTPPQPPPNGPAPAPAPAPPKNQSLVVHPKLEITYPFDFSQQIVNNTCPGYSEYAYKPVVSLDAGSPQFFVMTGVLSLLYALLSIIIYLLFSSTYDSIPIWPVADLIITGILCLFWLIASSAFSAGVSMLKDTLIYGTLEREICPGPFKSAGAQCQLADSPSWRSLNVGLVSGFTSFFLWGTGMWFVYKETHFHTPQDNFGPR